MRVIDIIISIETEENDSWNDITDVMDSLVDTVDDMGFVLHDASWEDRK